MIRIVEQICCALALLTFAAAFYVGTYVIGTQAWEFCTSWLFC